MQVTEREYTEALLTSNTLAFTQYFYRKRFNRRYIAAKHHVQIAEKLDKVLSGELTRLMINIFPRSGKTELAVKNFVAMGFAINPASKFIHLTYSNDLALDNSEEIRDEFIRNEEYQRIFPYVQIDKASTAKNKWQTTAGGGMYAAPAGGAITGFGAGAIDDITDEELEKALELSDKELKEYLDGITGGQGFNGAIIIDDPLKPDDAFSETARDKVNRRWFNTIKSRLNSINTPVIIIGQRLHPKDFCGYVLEVDGDEFEVLNIPALYYDEDNQPKSIWESKLPVKELLKLKERDEYTFQSQYQQNPKAQEGLLFPESELEFYDPESMKFDVNDYKELIVDPADGGDDYAGILGYVVNGSVYIDTIICNNNGLEENIPATVDLILSTLPAMTRIEGNGGWVQTAKDIRNTVHATRDDLDIFIYKETSNKEEKILSQAYFIKKRFFFRSDYEKIPEYRKAIEKLTSCYMRNKKGQKDDVPDVLANLSRYLRKNGIIE